MKYLSLMTLFLLHALYVTSDHVVALLAPNEAIAQVYILCGYMVIYMISFFRIGRFKYVLVLPYAALAYRALSGIMNSIGSDDHVFISGVCLSAVAIAVTVYSIIRDKGFAFPGMRIDRVVVLFWLTAVSVLSFYQIVSLSKSMNVYSVMGFALMVVAVGVTPLLVKAKEAVDFALCCVLVLLAIPYVQIAVSLPSDGFTLAVTGISLVLAVSTLMAFAMRQHHYAKLKSANSGS